MSYRISSEQSQSFEDDGFLVLRGVLSQSETKDLQRWAQEVHDWPVLPESPWMPYEEVNASGKRVLCRTENYADHHEGFNGLLRGEKLLGILEQLSGEPMNLFKEKTNYKLAGSGGFAAHIDSPAYIAVKNIKHLTILMAVDTSNMSNGGLEAVKGSHKMNVPLGEDLCIPGDWIQSHEWAPVELGPGDMMIFGPYLSHRSAVNRSNTDRKALYATYNRTSEGELHDAYYTRRAEHWPATHLRQPDKGYSEGQLIYGYGSPMLSVVTGKQLVFAEWKILVKTSTT